MNNYFVDSDKIVWRSIDGEAVIMNLDSGYYYSLNRIGTQVWQMLSERKDVPQIVASIEKQFSVPRARIEKDVKSILKELNKERLISKGK